MSIANLSIAIPGGPLPTHASNYVRRGPDGIFDEILNSRSAPVCAVIAPINGGASSFLNRVYRQAIALPQYSTYFVNIQDGFDSIRECNRLRLFQFLFRKIGVPNEILADEDDIEDLKVAFDKWALTEWSSRSGVVLIIDGVDFLFKRAELRSIGNALVNWLGALRNSAATGRPPYNKLVAFTALTGTTWSQAYMSQAASVKLMLDKFDQAQTVEALQQFRISDDRYVAASIYELFHGHPYLTQLFAQSMRSGLDFERAEHEALNLKGQYGEHWERLKSEIQLEVGGKHPLKTVLSVALTVTEDRDLLKLLSRYTQEIWDSYATKLKTFGLLDGPQTRPTICRFYRDAILNGTHLRKSS